MFFLAMCNIRIKLIILVNLYLLVSVHGVCKVIISVKSHIPCTFISDAWLLH